jgi:hypothetical protein
MYRAERVSPKPKQTEGAERKKVFSEGSICMMRMGLSVGFIVQTIRKNKGRTGFWCNGYREWLLSPPFFP